MLVRQAVTEPPLQFPESVFLLLYSSEAHFPLLSFLQARTFHLSPLPRSLSTMEGWDRNTGNSLNQENGSNTIQRFFLWQPKLWSWKQRYHISCNTPGLQGSTGSGGKKLFCQSSLYLILYDHQEGYRLPLHYSAT